MPVSPHLHDPRARAGDRFHRTPDEVRYGWSVRCSASTNATALPEGIELCERVDEVLLRLNQTGYLQELYQRWFDPA
jgi:ABC-type amino acid transport substrate-binding protein